MEEKIKKDKFSKKSFKKGLTEKGVFRIIIKRSPEQTNVAVYLSWLENSVHTRGVSGSNPLTATTITRFRQNDR